MRRLTHTTHIYTWNRCLRTPSHKWELNFLADSAICGTRRNIRKGKPCGSPSSRQRTDTLVNEQTKRTARPQRHRQQQHTGWEQQCRIKADKDSLCMPLVWSVCQGLHHRRSTPARKRRHEQVRDNSLRLRGTHHRITGLKHAWQQGHGQLARNHTVQVVKRR